MSKLYAGETAVWVTEQAIQILGGYGYIREHPVERWHRDAKIYTIFEGTSRDPAADHRPGHLRGAHPIAGLGLSPPDRGQRQTRIGSGEVCLKGLVPDCLSTATVRERSPEV